jgi:Replication protein A OB domain
VDVAGIVHSSTQYDMIEVKFDHGKDKVKGRLQFTVIDKNLDQITVYFWGDLSRMYISVGDIVIMNGARVSNFQGKSLNCGTEHCKILVNPAQDSINDLEKFVDVSKSLSKFRQNK